MAQKQLGAPDFTGSTIINGRFVPFWQFWLSTVRQLLTYVQVTAVLDFPLTASQQSSDLVVTFPTGSVALGDFPLLSPPPVALSDFCFTAHIAAVDQVTVRFNNYSAAGINPGSLSFNIRVLKQ